MRKVGHGNLANVVFVAVLALSAQVIGHAQAQFRSIVIESQPNAIVWIDNVRYGKTDKDGRLSIASVAPGARTIRARADGFKEKTQPLIAAQRVKIALIKTTDAAELAFQEAERLTSVDREKAAAAYRSAIKLRPNYPEAHLGKKRSRRRGACGPLMPRLPPSKAAFKKRTAKRKRPSPHSNARSPRARASSPRRTQVSGSYIRKRPKARAARAILTKRQSTTPSQLSTSRPR